MLESALPSWYDEYTERTFNIVGDNLPAIKSGTNGQNLPSQAQWAHATCWLTLFLLCPRRGWDIDVPSGAVSENNAKLDREDRLILDAGVMLGSGRRNIKAGVFGIYRSDALLLSSTKTGPDDDTFNTYENTNIRQYGIEIEGRTPQFFEALLAFANITIMDAERSEDGD